MIKISEADLDVGLRFLAATQNCQDTIYCLWDKPLVDADQKCPFLESRCPLLRFRKALGGESPAFMGFYKKVSNYDSVMHDYVLLEQEGDSFQKEEARKSLRDLSRFRQISLLALFSVYSANNGSVPYITKELIEKVSKDFSLELTIKELEEANPKWVNFLNAHCFNFERQEYYKYCIYLVIKVFIEALKEEEGIIEPLLFQEDKLKLFEIIEEHLKIRRE